MKLLGFWDRAFARVRALFGEPLDRSLRRRLRAAAPATLRELREEQHCRIAGTVGIHDHTALEAPLSGLRCVAYMIEITAWRYGERELVGYDKKSVPFLLEDDGHRAIIDATYCELLVRTQIQLRAYEPFTLSGRSLHVFERHVPLHSRAGIHRMHLREVIVQPGTRVSIAGTGHRETDPTATSERGYRDDGQQRLRFHGAAKLPLLIGDDPP
jgi:hypothetical protein